MLRVESRISQKVNDPRVDSAVDGRPPRSGYARGIPNVLHVGTNEGP